MRIEDHQAAHEHHEDGERVHPMPKACWKAMAIRHLGRRRRFRFLFRNDSGAIHSFFQIAEVVDREQSRDRVRARLFLQPALDDCGDLLAGVAIAEWESAARHLQAFHLVCKQVSHLRDDSLG